jgi:hypothetical protein
VYFVVWPRDIACVAHFEIGLTDYGRPWWVDAAAIV